MAVVDGTVVTPTPVTAAGTLGDALAPEPRAVGALRRRGPAVAVVATAAVFGAVLLVAEQDVRRVVSDLGLAAAALCAAGFGFARARHFHGRARTSSVLISGGALSWGLGQSAWSWFECVSHVDVPFPSLADIGYLGMPLFTCAGLLLAPQRSQSRANLARSVLDGAMVAAALLLISYLLLLRGMIHKGADNQLALVIGLAYPLCDIIAITIVIFAVSRGRRYGRSQTALLLLGAGLVTFSISDSGFAYLTMTDRYSSGSITDVGWFCGFLLILLAALRPVSAARTAPSEVVTERPVGIVLPYLVVLAAVSMSVADSFGTHGTNRFSYWDRTAMILLMVGRQVLTMLENRALTRGLEDRVSERTSELRASERRFRALVLHSSDVVTLIDRDAVVTYQSESVLRVLGHDPATMTARPLTDFVLAEDVPCLLRAVERVSRTPVASVTEELTVVHANGAERQVEMTITNLLADENVGALVCNTRDVTERRTLERQLVHEAFHDSLTGLANRALFRDRLDHELQRCDDDQNVAVLFLDLDGFKEINDSLGHAAGDRVLVAVAQRLAESVGREDTVARFGGDEFAILVPGAQADGGTRASEVAERALEAIVEPFTEGDHTLHVSASIGIAFNGVDARDAGQIMRNADLAMYRTKTLGAHGITLFRPDMHSELVERLELAADMRRGLVEDEFTIHFQPNIDLVSGDVIGFEALARWQHPTRGNIPPVEFIPLAEATGLIDQLGTWVLRTACAQARSWADEHGCQISMSVNVSARQLDRTDFVEVVAAALHDSGLEAQLLCLEMTESVLLNDDESVLQTLNAVKALGVCLAIDDFGTGYSSLSYLDRYPFDVLKIDKSFIDRVAEDTGDTATLARTIVQLGRGLGVRTVAEGLEHFDQFMVLRRMGCDVGQGYYFSRPVPADEAGELLATARQASWAAHLPDDGLSA